MPKRDLKSNEKLSTTDELVLMRMSIRAMRDQINENLDGMLDRINRLLPAEDTRISAKFKNFSRKDWHDYLNS